MRLCNFCNKLFQPLGKGVTAQIAWHEAAHALLKAAGYRIKTVEK